MGPLELLEPEPAGLFGREPAFNAFVELHNLVVAGADATGGSGLIDFGPEDADRIARERGVD
ncbi:hypothetical protein, partial [Bradyrhizobium sp. NBAIM08]|uniref:hypothetical protein n=1 Tax=Bradyrhizobium sp. NBAIM08 TaxID=2793815 RepID=UPI001CD5D75D